MNQTHALGDGTWAWAAVLKAFCQQYNLVWKVTDEIENKVFTYTVCSVLMKDSKKTTYKEMFDALDSIYLGFGVNRTGRIIPLTFRADHEKAVINEASRRWSDEGCLIVSCQFHYLQKQKDRLKKIDKFYL